MAAKRRTWRQRLATTAVIGGLAVGGAVVGTNALRDHMDSLPERAKPAARIVIKGYDIAKNESRRQVTDIMKVAGWPLFYRALGGAFGAWAVSSILAGKKTKRTNSYASSKKASKREGSHVEETSKSEVKGKTRSVLTATAAVAGFLYPTPVLTTAAFAKLVSFWRSRTPQERESVLKRLKIPKKP